MHDLAFLHLHLVNTIPRLLRPGGARQGVRCMAGGGTNPPDPARP